MLLIWWALTGGVWAFADPVLVPSPDRVLQATVGLFSNGGFAVDVLVTLRRVAIALIGAFAFGLPIGLFLGARPTWYRAVEGLIHALRSLPATALFPLLLIVLGVGEPSLIAVATYPGALIVLVNSASGAMLAEPARLRQARLLGMNDWHLLSHVLFFEALPLVLGSARTVVSYALVLVIAIEMFVGVGSRGLGRRIFDFQSSYQIPEAYAAIAITGIVGILLNSLLDRSERYFLRWRIH